MANTSTASGAQLAVLNTDHTLVTLTAAGTYVLKVDTAALQNGETVYLGVQGKARVGDALGPAYSDIAFTDVQANPLKFCLPVPTAGEDIVFTLRQEGGTGRTFPWNVLKLG